MKLANKEKDKEFDSWDDMAMDESIEDIDPLRISGNKKLLKIQPVNQNQLKGFVRPPNPQKKIDSYITKEKSSVLSIDDLSPLHQAML